MESLEELARKRFPGPPLSAAEERVVQHAADGTIADCRDLGGGDDPAKVDAWPASRNVRAGLIRWLCIDREAREQVDPKGGWIGGARITGGLDLSFTYALFPLVLWRCRVERDLDLKYAKMPLLSLEGSWTGAIFADGLKLEGSLFLWNAFHAEGEVRLLGATIGGDLTATGGTFKNLNGKALSADGARIGGSVFMKPEFNPEGVVKNKFVAEGEVRLIGAAIGRDLYATRGTFKSLSGKALTADRIEVTGSVFLRDGFSAEGEVRLPGATIGGDLDAAGGTFTNLKSDKNPNPTGNALTAAGIKVHGNVFLSEKFVAEGQVLLHSAEVNGHLGVDDAWLDALNLESAHVTGGFFWRNIHKDPHPDFPDKEWKPSLNLTDAKVGPLEDEEASWPEKGRLRLDGFVYDRVGGNAPSDAAARLSWLHRQPDELGYLPQPYEQLIAVFRRMGHEDQVAEVAIAKQWDMRKQGHLGWWGWIQNWFLYLAVGYGYHAWLAFIWLFVLIALGSCVFSRAHSANVLVPSDKEAYTEYEKSKMEKPPPYYPDLHAALYSLDVVLPFDLGQKSHWQLRERGPCDFTYWLFEFYSLIQLFIGWVLLLVAAAVPAGLIKKD